MNRTKIILFLLASTFVFSGCSIFSQPTPTPVPQKKNINTTLEGTVVQTAAGFAIQTSATTPIGIDSYEIPVKIYLQQKVRATGQYSGDTLFVDNIEMIQ